MIMRVHGLLILCTPVPVFIGEMVQNHNFFYERIVVVDLFIAVMPDGNQNIRDGCTSKCISCRFPLHYLFQWRIASPTLLCTSNCQENTATPAFIIER